MHGRFYNYVWTPQTDPDGIVHPHHRLSRRAGRPRQGSSARTNILSSRQRGLPRAFISAPMGLAPVRSRLCQLLPPSYTGGNIDDWRNRKGRAHVLSDRGRRRVSSSVGDRDPSRPRRQRTRRHGDRDFADRAISNSSCTRRRDLGGTPPGGLRAFRCVRHPRNVGLRPAHSLNDSCRAGSERRSWKGAITPTYRQAMRDAVSKVSRRHFS